jgi:hypothetical protein
MRIFVLLSIFKQARFRRCQYIAPLNTHITHIIRIIMNQAGVLGGLSYADVKSKQ